MSKLLFYHKVFCHGPGFNQISGTPVIFLKKCFKQNLPASFCITHKSKSTTIDLAQDDNITTKVLPVKPKTVPAWRPTPSTDRTNLIQHYMKLSKIRLTTLVVITTMGGYAMATAPFEWYPFVLCITGTGLLSCAANAVNQFHEVPFDAQMSRTKHRVLVCGRVTSLHSMLFATATSLSGLGILYYGVNGLTAALGLTNLVLYTAIYTPLKRISILNTWIGSFDRFHKAVKDGLIEVLKEATKRDCNGRDEQGMTPTLYAAFYGNLEALRLLCGRGGDPDKADLLGNTALYLAAAQGHKHVVTFLVNFGANIYARDIDGRTAQELAGMNNRDDILSFLDSVHAKMEASDKKKAKALKEKAKKDAEKRIKEFNKRQAKRDQLQEKIDRRMSKGHKPSVIETLKSRIKSGSMSNLSGVGMAPPRTSFSAIVGNGTISGNRNIGTVQRKALAKNNRAAIPDDDFKVSEIEDGKRSVRSLKGYHRDSEVLYGGAVDITKRGRLDGVFNEAEYINDTTAPPPSNGLTRSISQPDFLQDPELSTDRTAQEPASIFVRPGIGTIAIRKSIVNTFHGFYGNEGVNEESSIGSGDSYGPRTNMLTMEDELTDSESSEDENPNGPLERFLTAWGLGEYLPRFEEQKIDLETLMILTENDLKSLNLPLGPYRKLVTAINERKNALENPGEVTDSML